MPSPFPGMDPYLEHSDYWPECYSRLIVAIADALVPHIIPDVAVNQQKQALPAPQSVSQATTTTAYPRSQPITVTVPLMEQVKQNYLEVRDVASGQVIAVLEMGMCFSALGEMLSCELRPWPD